MKTQKSTRNSSSLRALLAAALLLPLAPLAQAADHGDAPTLAHDQGADAADAYFFIDPNDSTQAVIIGTFHGFIVPGEAANFGIFDPVLRYRFEIFNNHVNIVDDLIVGTTAFKKKVKPNKYIDVSFSPRTAVDGPEGKANLQVPQPQLATVRFTGFPGMANKGVFKDLPATNPSVGSVEPTQVVSSIETGVGTVQFFAGMVDDPFFFDIPAFSAYIGSVRNGAPDITKFDRARDSFAGYNVMSIALRVPVALLKGANGNFVGLDFLTQRHNVEIPTGAGTVKGVGVYKTVDRIATPAVNVALIPFNKKNSYNTGRPETDAKGRFAGDIVETLHELGTDDTHVGILASVAVTYGDILRLDTAKANTGTGGGDNAGSGFPNGRRLKDDVVDTLLFLISNELLTTGDKVNSSDLLPTDAFPFLHPAQQPRDNGVTDDNTRN